MSPNTTQNVRAYLPWLAFVAILYIVCVPVYYNDTNADRAIYICARFLNREIITRRRSTVFPNDYVGLGYTEYDYSITPKVSVTFVLLKQHYYHNVIVRVFMLSVWKEYIEFSFHVYISRIITDY